MAVERILSERELNRALLARQGLLEPLAASLPKTLERIGGIQAQYAPAMYVGLFARMAKLDRATVTRALERRTVVQGTLLRSTIHLVSPRDWWTWSIAIREARRESFVRSHGGEPPAAKLAVAAKRVRARLAGAEPVPRKEMQELAGLGATGTNAMSVWLELVRVPPSGTWERRRADLFALAEDWIGPQPGVDRAEATGRLVRSYLRGFGPAAPVEIAGWAGLPVKPVAEALKRIELRQFRDESGRELVDLPRLPLADGETPAPVRLLPAWDATLLVHARRTQILPDEHRPRVFSIKTPQSVNTFLVDGRVAGGWRLDGKRIVATPFAKLDPAARRQLDREVERLEAFHV